MSLLLTLSALISAAALSSTEAASPTAKEGGPASYKVVCKTFKVTGTRLNRGQQVCMTKKQWEQEEDEVNRSVRGGLGRNGKTSVQ